MVFGIAGAVAGHFLPGAGGVPERLARIAWVGAPLLEIRLPAQGQEVPVGAVEVLVGFPDAGRVAEGTFRCLLNDDDITERLTLGSNGAGGSLVGLVAGENRLRVEVFGKAWWGSRFVQEAHLILFEVRPTPYLDRAAVDPDPAAPALLPSA